MEGKNTFNVYVLLTQVQSTAQRELTSLAELGNNRDSEASFWRHRGKFDCDDQRTVLFERLNSIRRMAIRAFLFSHMGTSGEVLGAHAQK